MENALGAQRHNRDAEALDAVEQWRALSITRTAMRRSLPARATAGSMGSTGRRFIRHAEGESLCRQIRIGGGDVVWGEVFGHAWSPNGAITVPPEPALRLQIARTPNAIILSWTGPGVLLESAPNVAGP